MKPGKESRQKAERPITLKAVAEHLVLGGPPECPSRPLCLPGLQKTYGLTFERFEPLDAGGPITVAELDSGLIDVAMEKARRIIMPARNGGILHAVYRYGQLSGSGSWEDLKPLKFAGCSLTRGVSIVVDR